MKFYWLIEDAHQERPIWWHPDGWTSNAANAIWFGRASDAENVIAFINLPSAVATEHGFE